MRVNERQQLVVNLALRDVIDYYLLQQAGEGDMGDLKDYLKNKLPPTAYDEAVQIVDHYQAYMRAHDELLAGQDFGTQRNAAPDLKRVAAWRTQRDRLRQAMFGDAVKQAWYQNDDAQLEQALEELEQRGEDASSLSAASGPARPVPHWENSSEEQQHMQYQLGVLVNATTSFTARKQIAQ